MLKTLRRAKQSTIDFLVYAIGISLISIFKSLPRSLLCRLGRIAGVVVFHTVPDYRKTALTNLALAFPDKTLKERFLLAKQSIQHVMITLLELLAVEGLVHNLDNLISIATSETQPEGFCPHEVLTNEELDATFAKLNENEGVILFCGHQANWELPFLYITRDYPGLAFAKPINNARLNKKIFSLREIFKGKIVSPKQGIHHALQSLHQGHVIGIVGDQALLLSSYAYPLFGNDAFTTTTPALLAYKTGKPVIAISVYRNENGYQIIPSKRFYADKSLPLKESTSLLMNNIMGFLEKGIACKPEQWMWMHKRWKRKVNNKIKKRYSYSRILVVMKQDAIEKNRDFLIDLANLYSGALLTLAVQNQTAPLKDLPQYIVKEFCSHDDLRRFPNSFPAIFDFAELPKPLHKYFKKSGSVALYTAKDLEKKLRQPNSPLITALNGFLKKS
ncbi:LpxL/LpxP family acyltransferase [Chlamydia vaughanii]|uniref:LpxL/LpxP family acyltransferase n=1 Tax=Chlamydia vaughanii TaxID=3112552 RepID=UPI0032B27C8F